MKSLLSVVGARPQFVKVAPFCEAVRGVFGHVLVHTGQHYDRNMSDFFFRDLRIPRPDHELGIGGGSHGEQTGRMLEALEKVILKVRPDAVVVFGDTNSTLAGALAAVKLHIPVVHVEAGLRSFNREMPEEHNRVATDHLSDLLLAPSRSAMEQLEREGLGARARLVGDIMFDALLRNAPMASQKAKLRRRMGLDKGTYYFATVHRPANTDDPAVLGRLLEAFASLDRPVVFAVHPRTRKMMDQAGLEVDEERVRLVEPLGYFETLDFVQNCVKVLTDSGGLQKEAFYLRKPVVVLREESEWVEIVECGWAVLAGSDIARIRQAVRMPAPSGRLPSCYGRGDAAVRMVREIRRFLG